MSIQAVESLILLVIILPIVKNISQAKFHIVPTKVDLFIARFGFLFMGTGCLILALSQTLIAFILGMSSCCLRAPPHPADIYMVGLLVFTLGCSTRPALQSLLTDLVSREHISVLYAVIAVSDGIGSAAGAFILNRSFAIAIGWDNKLYFGLPFVIGVACYGLGFIGSMLVSHSTLLFKRNV